MELNEILNKISVIKQIPTEIIKSRTNKREVVYARFIFMGIARQLTDKSDTEIGLVIKRDRTTVINGLKQCLYVKEVRDEFNEVLSELG